MAQGEGRESDAAESRRRISADISEASHQSISRLKAEWGLRNRGAVIDRLLLDLFKNPVDQDEDSRIGSGGALAGDAVDLPSRPEASCLDSIQNKGLAPNPADPQSDANSNERVSSGADQPPELLQQANILARTESRGFPEVAENASEDDSDSPHSLFTETGALVLVQREGNLEASLEFDEQPVTRSRSTGRRAGIDLPGFVRRNTEQLRRSLNPPAREQLSHGDVLPSLAGAELLDALETAEAHWLSLYGQPANEAVLEASMTWLAQDIWTQSEQSEGEAFTWTLAQRMIATCAPSWQEGPPTLERVIVLAGLLEDPFSASTLSLRIPTLIRRFVHRFRRRRRGASFQTLEHTMTLHGALKVLQIPIDSGRRLTLSLIRDAYHEMAMNHHPDAGGSAEMMRRLNEAYQLLKELYRNKEA